MPKPLASDPMDFRSVSFAGCAWLFPYHLGVISSLRLLPDFKEARFLGASSGSLAALIACLDLDIDRMMNHTVAFATDANERRFGPIGRMTRYVSSGLSRELPDDAWQRVAGRMQVAVTVLPHMRGALIDAGECRSNKELVQLLLGSCYIPVYYERPVVWSRRLLIDGGLRNNQPRWDEKTILVSPQGLAPGSLSHIYPEVPPKFREILFPRPDRLRELFLSGQNDASRWIETGAWG